MSVEYNSQLANRQTEINEWSYQNKMDTLFVFQLLFISMLIVSILMMFSYNGIIGRHFVGYAFGILVIINVIVIINRSMYTNNIRDKYMWDRVLFKGDQELISPKGRDAAYIAKLDAAYGENGVVLTPAERAAIIASSAFSSTLARQYNISEETINTIRRDACGKCP